MEDKELEEKAKEYCLKKSGYGKLFPYTKDAFIAGYKEGSKEAVEKKWTDFDMRDFARNIRVSDSNLNVFEMFSNWKQLNNK